MSQNHVKYEDGLSWCAETLDSSFHFKDIEQVTINNLPGERLPCQYCLRAILTVLLTLPPCIQLTDPALDGKLGSYGGTM